MRSVLSLLSTLFLLACGTSPGTPLEDSSNSPAQSYQITLPAQYAATQEFTLYASLKGTEATALTEIVYGLAPGYPSNVVTMPKGGYLRGPECSIQEGAVTWSSIAAQDGTAARVSLEQGKLSVVLLEEGTYFSII